MGSEKTVNPRAINPRYRGAKMSDVARALVTDPITRSYLEELWEGRSVAPAESRDDDGRVNSTR